MKLKCPYCGTGTFVPEPAAWGASRELRCQQCRTEIALAQVDAAESSSARERRGGAPGSSSARGGASTRVELFDGRYEKLGPAAESGQGFVYPAYDRTLRTFVAVKELTSETPVARFEREIEFAKVLTHENIIVIYDHGQSRDIRYLTMEFLEGASLDRLLEAEDISYERSLDLMIMACHGLEHVHVRGVVHRALEPAKLFVTSEGVLKVMDFGSAVTETEAPPAFDASAIVTRGYTAPEQAVTPRTDVWSLGAIAYRLFAGVLPYPDLDPRETTRDGPLPAPPSARNTRVPPELDALILRALASRPEDRPADAGELCEQLMALRRKYSSQAAAVAPISSIRPGPTTPGQRSPRALLLAGVAAAAVLGGGALFLHENEPRHATDAAPAAPRDALAARAESTAPRARVGGEEPIAPPPRAAAAVASGPSVRQAPPPRQAEPAAPPSASHESGPGTLLSAPRCPSGTEPVPARELQLTQPRPRAWSFAEHTLPARSLDGFCMDSRSVSVAAYTKCVEEGRCTPHEVSCTPSNDPSAAMKCVSWAAAQQYCASRGATLPSVAQWEAYAQSEQARVSTSEWSLDAFPPAVFAARCNEDNPARCDGHLWRKAGRLPTVAPDGRGRLAFSWNRGAATSDTGYDYVSFRCALPAPVR
ncbi:MAG: serine/threonine protein kinase [Myxococcaceae bacterium]|nr:serine/threonine protein kinase [Myxococcaceae bacterium]